MISPKEYKYICTTCGMLSNTNDHSCSHCGDTDYWVETATYITDHIVIKKSKDQKKVLIVEKLKENGKDYLYFTIQNQFIIDGRFNSPNYYALSFPFEIIDDLIDELNKIKEK